MKVGGGLAPPLRPPRAPGRRAPRRIVHGAVELLLWVVLGGALTTALGTGVGWWKGHSAGYAEAEGKAATERANLATEHRADMDKMRADAKATYDAALLDAAQRYDRLDTVRKEAQRALADEQNLTRRLRGDLAAAVRDRDRMRDAIAVAASGGVTEADDSIAACRARADAIGRALGEALQAHRTCSLDLEDAGGGTRALMRYSAAVEASQRAVTTPPGE